MAFYIITCQVLSDKITMSNIYKISTILVIIFHSFEFKFGIWMFPVTIIIAFFAQVIWSSYAKQYSTDLVYLELNSVFLISISLCAVLSFLQAKE